MKNLLIGGALAAVLAMPTIASAEARYDRKLEQAAIEIAVAKLGELRGGLSYDAEPVKVLQLDLNPTASISPVGGLSVAVERRQATIF